MKLLDCQLPPAVLEKNESGPDDAIFRIDLQFFFKDNVVIFLKNYKMRREES